MHTLETSPDSLELREGYDDLVCDLCESGDRPDELLLCDKCDKGFHMKCVRPIVFRVPIGSWLCPNCLGTKRVRRFTQGSILDFFGIRSGDFATKPRSPSRYARRRRRTRPLVGQKKKWRLLPFIPSDDPDQRLKQMGSLASALTAMHMDYSDHLTYMPGMAPESANDANLERKGIQSLSKEDTKTLEKCKAMSRRGECPPFMVVFDSREGYTVEADGLIKAMTFIAEYTGDVDYVNKRESDDGDSMMTLILSEDESKKLVICADKRGNISRFINGINNHTQEGKKKQNCKSVRYNVDGQSRVFLVATRDIAKGERLYYDYNGYEHRYPTENFV
ncbi:probable Histone-lysine N-methyltransferase ATXR5 [Lotus japonicus]|uniref:probable Histone-lysine N-methyltransferase ATXR5 n=1 Tax=Lotus japonicus TaxID=34305 RepID=UPI00258DC064|nr:probable Histone-lysine N-methyltransferase ATXR5 [Lotus japonicus]XP_057418224.1 probable Histone-lysine N-methyltransferase ATXR5 [Lotus japonicus]